MASGNLTITAPVGPGKTVSSLVLNAVQSINFQMDREVIEVIQGNKTLHFDYETVATVTFTISGEVATITIST